MFDQIKTIFLLFTRDKLKMLLLRKPEKHIVNIKLFLNSIDNVEREPELTINQCNLLVYSLFLVLVLTC